MKNYRFWILSLLGTSVLPAFAGENWPGWRGPRGDGSSPATNLPVTWSGTENVVWKTPLPGKGHASLIIWEDTIFTVTSVEDSEARLLVCMDRKTGATRWQKVVVKTPYEKVHRLNSHASSTPATDGERVYVSFLDEGRMYVAAYDFEGNRLWENRPGVFSSKHGYCSSPVLWKDTVIVNGDHDGDAYIVSLDKKSGKLIWKTDRPNKTRSYCVPIIRTIDGRNQLILSGSKSVASYDPDTGEQHWVIDGPTEQYVASLVYNKGLLFMTAGFPDHHILAIRPDGTGNVTDTHIAWRTTRGCSYVPSPAACKDYFLVVSDKGIASCFDAESGERYWMERLGQRFSASTINANGLVYFTSDEGVISVVKADKQFNVVASNDMGERVYSSPAVYDGKLYIRGSQHVFCVGK